MAEFVLVARRHNIGQGFSWLPRILPRWSRRVGQPAMLAIERRQCVDPSRPHPDRQRDPTRQQKQQGPMA
jgi:hypothetical protein